MHISYCASAPIIFYLTTTKFKCLQQYSEKKQVLSYYFYCIWKKTISLSFYAGSSLPNFAAAFLQIFRQSCYNRRIDRRSQMQPTLLIFIILSCALAALCLVLLIVLLARRGNTAAALQALSQKLTALENSKTASDEMCIRDSS